MGAEDGTQLSHVQEKCPTHYTIFLASSSLSVEERGEAHGMG